MTVSRYRQIYLFFFSVVLIISCTNDKRIDVSNVQADVKIERFDRDMSMFTPENVAEKAPLLQKKYGYFYADYMERMLAVGPITDTGYYDALRQVLQSRDYQELKSAVAEKYPDMQPVQDELTDAFKHVRYYYPKQKLPRLITFFSGFAVQTPIGNDYIGIGLDMFLGANSKFYPALRRSIPQYISHRFTPENITPRVMEAFVREDFYPEKDNDRTLLAKMVYNGKVLYFMDAVMPDVADSLKIGYTKEQLEWCNEFENEVWAFYLENNLLFETDYMKIQKYLTDAPFTPGLGENGKSAPKLAVWTGWQMVKKYMAKNPEVTLQQLMQETDAQKILKESKYKPK